MYEYQVLSFDRAFGTYIVEFLDGGVPTLNYHAPRLSHVYLGGQALEDAIQLLRKPYDQLTPQELQIIFPKDDPAIVTGGEDIEAKVINK
jgi:hypothetical protein